MIVVAKTAQLCSTLESFYIPKYRGRVPPHEEYSHSSLFCEKGSQKGNLSTYDNKQKIFWNPHEQNESYSLCLLCFLFQSSE